MVVVCDAPRARDGGVQRVHRLIQRGGFSDCCEGLLSVREREMPCSSDLGADFCV